MNNIRAMLSVVVVLMLVSFVSCAKKEVAAEKIASPEIRSSESAQSADKTEIVRLRGLLEAAGKEFALLRENGNTLIQANHGLATELLAAKDALKAKEGEIEAISLDLKKALETGSRGKKVLMAQMAALNKEKDALIVLQSSLSEKLRSSEEKGRKISDDLAGQKALYMKEKKEWGERLNKKDMELMKAQEDMFQKKTLVGGLLLLLLLSAALHIWTFIAPAKVNKPQPVTQ